MPENGPSTPPDWPRESRALARDGCRAGHRRRRIRIMRSRLAIVTGLVGLLPTGSWGDEAKPAGQQAGGALIRSAGSGPWSEPATWEGGRVPGEGARVQVRAGHTVTYETSS